MSIEQDVRDQKITQADAIGLLEGRLDRIEKRMNEAGKLVDQLAEKRGSVKKGK